MKIIILGSFLFICSVIFINKLLFMSDLSDPIRQPRQSTQTKKPMKKILTSEFLDGVIYDPIRNQILDKLKNSQHVGCFIVSEPSLPAYKKVLNAELPTLGYEFTASLDGGGGGYADISLNNYRICIFPK